MIDLAGQVALVTGAGSPNGIGFACARLLAAQGAAVVLVSTTDRILDRTAEIGTSNALGLVADLTDPAQAAACVDATVERFAGIHIV